ncbi:hypothetical protein [Bradyrhizobium sp.]|uniref:hypothetical protein n=1 Tax=Bradyrhizobium sp. TaxID=376 RepID=UPI0025BB9F66|nr:hypothetical protein [Bradyrhizobium sp.]
MPRSLSMMREDVVAVGHLIRPLGMHPNILPLDGGWPMRPTKLNSARSTRRNGACSMSPARGLLLTGKMPTSEYLADFAPTC